MLMNVMRGMIAVVVFCPHSGFGQEGEKCMRDTLELHIRDQQAVALKMKPPGPVMESACRSAGGIVTCYYYDNRSTPNIPFELRVSLAKLITCFEHYGKASRAKDNKQYASYDLPRESCSIGEAAKEFDAWSFPAQCSVQRVPR